MTTGIHCNQYNNELVGDTTEYIFDNFTSIQSVYDIEQLIKEFLGDEYTLTVDEMVYPLEVDEDELIAACDEDDACNYKSDIIMEIVNAKLQEFPSEDPVGMDERTNR